ncbi:MAG: hypothetical protein ACK526_17290 [Planctomyces sp.]
MTGYPLSRGRNLCRELARRSCCFGFGLSMLLCGCAGSGHWSRSLELSDNAPVRSESSEPEFDLPGRNSNVQPADETAFRELKSPEFQWTPEGRTAGGRPFQLMKIGEDGFRTIVVGSVGGNDPLAGEFVEQLARHLQQNSVIYGGFQSTILRTLNPDGEKSHRYRNDNGIYINHSFPRTAIPGSGNDAQQVAPGGCPEAEFMLKLLGSVRPERVIHIRSIRGKTGLIASSSSAQDAAREVAEWLSFDQMTLPGKSVDGSLERYLSTSGSIQMLTFGIPETAAKDELWANYGDAVLNLLLRDDPMSRELARRQSGESSADSRGKK